MKRKQAKTHNLGGTYQYMSVEDLNRIQTGCFPNPVSSCFGTEIYGGKDYSYKTSQGTAPATFRKHFNIWNYALGNMDELGDDVFELGRLGSDNGSWIRPVYYFFGYRIVVEYFDTNAIVDFTGKIDDGAICEQAMRKFVQIFSKKFDVKIVNEHLINIKSKENDYETAVERL